MQPGTADVVIIGGGVMGVSAAHHLTGKGCRGVVLLEREEFFGAGATGQNAGGVRHQFSTAINIELSRRSIQMLRDFHEELNQELSLNFCGYLFLLDNEKDLERFRANVELQNRLGVGTRLLEPSELEAMVPEIRLEGMVGGTFYDGDGLADPAGVVQGYVSSARRQGATLLTNTPAIQLRIEDGRVRAVRTPNGWISTESVLIAGGPWSAQIGRIAGIDLPVAPVRRQIAVTESIPGLDPSFPFVIDFSRSLYFHYEGGGILTGMSNPDQSPGFDTSVDEDWRLVHFEQAIRRMPLLADAAIAAEWAGLYEVTPDHQPILGRLPHAEGLFACTGFSGHGFMHGPICGLLVAEEILDGAASTVNIDPLRWDRFARGETSGEYSAV
jgi:sarcosine oxidase subunit beta